MLWSSVAIKEYPVVLAIRPCRSYLPITTNILLHHIAGAHIWSAQLEQTSTAAVSSSNAAAAAIAAFITEDLTGATAVAVAAIEPDVS